VPSETDDSEALGQNKAEISQAEKPAVSEINAGGGGAGVSGGGNTGTETEKDKAGGTSRKATIGGGNGNGNGGGVEPFDKAERDAMEKLLEDLCGHLGGCFHDIIFLLLWKGGVLTF
jgi:hypothetical protein